MITVIFTALLALVVILGVYFAAHRLLPTWGTIITNALAALALVLDVAGALPWGSLLEQKTTAAIMFALAVGNAIMRTVGVKHPVGSMK